MCVALSFRAVCVGPLREVDIAALKVDAEAWVPFKSDLSKGWRWNHALNWLATFQKAAASTLEKASKENTPRQSASSRESSVSKTRSSRSASSASDSR